MDARTELLKLLLQEPREPMGITYLAKDGNYSHLAKLANDLQEEGIVSIRLIAYQAESRVILSSEAYSTRGAMKWYLDAQISLTEKGAAIASAL